MRLAFRPLTHPLRSKGEVIVLNRTRRRAKSHQDSLPFIAEVLQIGLRLTQLSSVT